jgi:hypothetical protein
MVTILSTYDGCFGAWRSPKRSSPEGLAHLHGGARGRTRSANPIAPTEKTPEMESFGLKD